MFFEKANLALLQSRQLQNKYRQLQCHSSKTCIGRYYLREGNLNAIPRSVFFISVVVVVRFTETPTAEFGILINASLARMKLGLHGEAETPQLVLLQLVVQQTVVNLVILKAELFVLATRNAAPLLVL